MADSAIAAEEPCQGPARLVNPKKRDVHGFFELFFILC
jgi:hypothetical protein